MSSPADEAPVPEIDTSRPHSARVYDYFLGGKDHFAAAGGVDNPLCVDAEYELGQVGPPVTASCLPAMGR